MAADLPVDTGAHPVILFDGVCNLCNGAVNFLIDRDPEARFRLAALQSDAAAPFRRAFGIDGESLESVVLIEDGRCYERSDAALRIARHLDGPWPLFWTFAIVPRPVRDAIYDSIARNRYRWFGKREQCRFPTPDLQARFL